MPNLVETPFLGDLLEGIKLKVQNPSPVTNIYHYTTMVGLERIKEAGFLHARTSPLRPGHTNSNIEEFVDKNAEFFDGKYIVAGVNSPGFDAWKNFDIHDRLLEYVARTNYWLNSTPLALLSFPIEVVQDAYILDHAHDSPKRSRKLYGIEITSSKQPEYLTQLERYYRSLVRLSDYNGKYQVPEIWIPHSVRYEDIMLVGIATVAELKLPYNIFEC